MGFQMVLNGRNFMATIKNFKRSMLRLLKYSLLFVTLYLNFLDTWGFQSVKYNANLKKNIYKSVLIGTKTYQLIINNSYKGYDWWIHDIVLESQYRFFGKGSPASQIHWSSLKELPSIWIIMTSLILSSASRRFLTQSVTKGS